MPRLVSSLHAGAKIKDPQATYQNRQIYMYKTGYENNPDRFLVVIRDSTGDTIKWEVSNDVRTSSTPEFVLGRWLEGSGTNWSGRYDVSYKNVLGFKSLIGKVGAYIRSSDLRYATINFETEAEKMAFKDSTYLDQSKAVWAGSSRDRFRYMDGTWRFHAYVFIGDQVYDNRYPLATEKHYVTPVITLDTSTLLVSDEPDTDGAYVLIWNTAPSTPDTISYPTTPTAGTSITLTTVGSTDADDDPITYVWERKVDSGVYETIGSGSGKTLVTTVPSSGTTVTYRVKATDGQEESAYVTGPTRTINYNTPPKISGSDTNLGALQAPPTYNYTIADAESESVSVLISVVSGGQTRVLENKTVPTGVEQNVTISLQDWLRYPVGTHTITIRATDDSGGIDTRRVTFSRVVNRLAGARAFSTQGMVTKALVSVFPIYRPADSVLKLEVTNNPFDTAPVWEDITSKVNQYVHSFSNTTATSGNGFAYRFTMTKGSHRIELNQFTIKFASNAGEDELPKDPPKENM